MDFINKVKDQATSASGNQNTGAANTGGNAASSSGQEDYGDKALDAAEKKFGYTQSRETNEKITDGARGLFEKATGKQVDSKYSN